MWAVQSEWVTEGIWVGVSVLLRAGGWLWWPYCSITGRTCSLRQLKSSNSLLALTNQLFTIENLMVKTVTITCSFATFNQLLHSNVIQRSLFVVKELVFQQRPVAHTVFSETTANVLFKQAHVGPKNLTNSEKLSMFGKYK